MVVWRGVRSVWGQPEFRAVKAFEGDYRNSKWSTFSAFSLPDQPSMASPGAAAGGELRESGLGVTVTYRHGAQKGHVAAIRFRLLLYFHQRQLNRCCAQQRCYGYSLPSSVRLYFNHDLIFYVIEILVLFKWHSPQNCLRMHLQESYLAIFPQLHPVLANVLRE